MATSLSPRAWVNGANSRLTMWLHGGPCRQVGGLLDEAGGSRDAAVAEFPTAGRRGQEVRNGQFQGRAPVPGRMGRFHLNVPSGCTAANGS